MGIKLDTVVDIRNSPVMTDGIDKDHEAYKFMTKNIATHNDKLRIEWGKKIASQQPVQIIKDWRNEISTCRKEDINLCIEHISVNMKKAMEFAGVGTEKTVKRAPGKTSVTKAPRSCIIIKNQPPELIHI